MRTVCNQKKTFIPLILTGLLLAAGESFAAGNGPDVTLKVKPQTERNREKKEDIKEDANGTEITTTTQTETELCTLFVEVKMRDKPTLDCQLEWYFISGNIKSAKDKGTTVIFSPGKKSLLLKDFAWPEESITSTPFVITTIRRSDSESDDKISGDEYKGYIVLVRQGGEILAKASNSSLYLKEEWISKCK